MSLFAVGICYVYIYHSCSLAATPPPPSQVQVHVALSHVAMWPAGWRGASDLTVNHATWGSAITCITLKNGLLKEHLMASLPQWCHHMPLDFCRTFVASGVLAMVAKRDHFMHIAPTVDHMYGCSGYHSIMKLEPAASVGSNVLSSWWFDH